MSRVRRGMIRDAWGYASLSGRRIALALSDPADCARTLPARAYPRSSIPTPTTRVTASQGGLVGQRPGKRHTGNATARGVTAD